MGVLDSKTILIAGVDCTSTGEQLCNEIDVRGYVTIKFDDSSNLEDHKWTSIQGLEEARR